MQLLRVIGHLNVVLGHFCNISYMYLQNIDQICHAILVFFVESIGKTLVK